MPFLFVVSLVLVKVTSKGVGLNPNAKVWQEIPVVPSEVPADATHWSPSDVNEGEPRKSPTVQPNTLVCLKHEPQFCAPFFDIVGVLTFWVQICMRHTTQDVLVKPSQIACPSIAAYSEASECKPYAMGFTALEECLPTPTAEVAVNGMDPPELGFPSDEPITVTSGQSPT